MKTFREKAIIQFPHMKEIPDGPHGFNSLANDWLKI